MSWSIEHVLLCPLRVLRTLLQRPTPDAPNDAAADLLNAYEAEFDGLDGYDDQLRW